MELATMVDRNFRDVYQKLAELPLRRYVEVLRNKAQDLTSQLGDAAYFDQYPSKRVPWIFSRTYGPIPLTAPRHYDEVLDSGTTDAASTDTTLTDTTKAWTVDEWVGCAVKIITSFTTPGAVGQTGIIVSNTATTVTISTSWALANPGLGSTFQILQNAFNQDAALANPDSFILPREGTIKTGRDAAFVWCSSNAFAYLSWTYDAAPVLGPTYAGQPPPVTSLPAGDILDPVLPMNGGAIIVPNIANANYNSPRVCFEMALYDKKRGRYLTDGKLPAEAFVGGAFSNKLTPKQTRWNVDTEIEPRISVTEVSMGPPLGLSQPYSVANVAAYINVVFVGYNVLEERYNEADTFSAVKSRG
jgi:hypothetical protein